MVNFFWCILRVKIINLTCSFVSITFEKRSSSFCWGIYETLTTIINTDLSLSLSLISSLSVVVLARLTCHLISSNRLSLRIGTRRGIQTSAQNKAEFPVTFHIPFTHAFSELHCFLKSLPWLQQTRYALGKCISVQKTLA